LIESPTPVGFAPDRRCNGRLAKCYCRRARQEGKHMTKRTAYLAAAAISALAAPALGAGEIRELSGDRPNVVKMAAGHRPDGLSARTSSCPWLTCPAIFSGSRRPTRGGIHLHFWPSGGFGDGLGTFASFSSGDPVAGFPTLVPITMLQARSYPTLRPISTQFCFAWPDARTYAELAEDYADTFTLDIGGRSRRRFPSLTWAMMLMGLAGSERRSGAGRPRSISA
jgi:hypothetical protein